MLQRQWSPSKLKIAFWASYVIRRSCVTCLVCSGQGWPATAIVNTITGRDLKSERLANTVAKIDVVPDDYVITNPQDGVDV